MKEVVDNNMPLTIYPAGLMSEQGIATPIPDSTGKFLKWLKQDVYIAKIRGTYLTKPKWSKVRRKGKKDGTFHKIQRGGDPDAFSGKHQTSAAIRSGKEKQ